MSEVQVGQVWKDLDSRMNGRLMYVVDIGEEDAWLVPLDANGTPMRRVRPTRLLLRRMNPRNKWRRADEQG